MISENISRAGKAGKKLLRNRKGSTIIIFAAALTVFAACAALVIDIGSIVLEKAQLSAAVDSAALAGLQEHLTGSGSTNIVVDNFLTKNVGTVNSSTITVAEDNKSIQVTAAKEADSFFGGFTGSDFTQVSATAIAKAETIVSMTGARPLAVIQQTFIFGQQYTLKEGASDGISGNYAAMALGGGGASIYRDNLLYGYAGTITVGDLIETETGNIAGTTQTCIDYLIGNCPHTPSCTYDLYNSTCPRIISIPVVNTLDVNGKKYVKVLGFATFFLEGVTNHAGQADVTGRFITYCADGETSTTVTDYGTYGIRLVK